MRDNTFADEMVGWAAMRVVVLPSRANAVHAIGGVAWQVRLRIIEANLAAFSGQPKCEFLPSRTPAHRKMKQQKRHGLLEGRRNPGTQCIQSRRGPSLCDASELDGEVVTEEICLPTVSTAREHGLLGHQTAWKHISLPLFRLSLRRRLCPDEPLPEKRR